MWSASTSPFGRGPVLSAGLRWEGRRLLRASLEKTPASEEAQVKRSLNHLPTDEGRGPENRS